MVAQITGRLTDLSPAPQRGPGGDTPTVYRAKADVRRTEENRLTGEFNGMVVEANAVAVEVNTNAVAAAQSVTDAQEKVALCQDEVVLAAGHADTAEQHKETAKGYAENILLSPALSTSTTSMTISKGSKPLTTDIGKSYTPAMWVVIIDKTDPKIWMKGYVTAYDSETGSLAVMITDKSGDGAYSDWLITQTNPIVLSAPRPTIANTLLYS